MKFQFVDLGKKKWLFKESCIKEFSEQKIAKQKNGSFLSIQLYSCNEELNNLTFVRRAGHLYLLQIQGAVSTRLVQKIASDNHCQVAGLGPLILFAFENKISHPVVSLRERVSDKYPVLTREDDGVPELHALNQVSDSPDLVWEDCSFLLIWDDQKERPPEGVQKLRKGFLSFLGF